MNESGGSQARKKASPLCILTKKVKGSIASLRDEITRLGTNPPDVLRNLDLDSVTNIVEIIKNASLRREDSPPKNVSPETDAAFAEAETNGDKATAQRLVNDAAGFDASPPQAWLPEGNHRESYQLDFVQTRKGAEIQLLEVP